MTLHRYTVGMNAAGKSRHVTTDAEDALIAANPNLTTENFALTCSHGELIDVRICIPKTLDGYVDCPKIARHSCHARTLSVAPLR